MRGIRRGLRIGVEDDAMRDALAFDDGLASLAVKGEAHGEYQSGACVALRASRRADVGLARRRRFNYLSQIQR